MFILILAIAMAAIVTTTTTVMITPLYIGVFEKIPATYHHIEKAVTTKTGLNNVSGVIWALGKILKYFICIFLILTYIYRL